MLCVSDTLGYEGSRQRFLWLRFPLNGPAAALPTPGEHRAEVFIDPSSVHKTFIKASAAARDTEQVRGAVFKAVSRLATIKQELYTTC